MLTIVDKILAKLLGFFQSFGWYIVFAASLWYFMQPQLQELAAARSLAEANDPARRAVLDAELKRVRAKQALEAAQSEEDKPKVARKRK